MPGVSDRPAAIILFQCFNRLVFGFLAHNPLQSHDERYVVQVMLQCNIDASP
jgi:hypothetical protein